MSTPIHDYFTEDHNRLEALLDKATVDMDNIDMDIYHEFRTGMLKHIKMEEKVLFPAAQKGNNDVPLPLAAQLRLEHGAITALLVVNPDAEVVKVLRYVVEDHDRKEEEPGGMYDICERLTESETESLLEELRNTTEVPVRPHNMADYVLDVAKRTMTRAGWDYDEILNLQLKEEEK